MGGIKRFVVVGVLFVVLVLLDVTNDVILVPDIPECSMIRRIRPVKLNPTALLAISSFDRHLLKVVLSLDRG